MSSLIVTVCKVDKIEKHPNADRLSLVHVKGWQCIVGLDQYQAGDLVVFIPPDCILPDALIEKYKLEYLKKNGRTGTIKLRGYISQGLIIDADPSWNEGKDVAGLLGITKYEPPEPEYQVPTKKTSRKKINPNFDKYTDIENVKHYQDVFVDGDLVVITEKIHGCNSRFGNLEIVINPNTPFFDRIELWIRKNMFGQKHEFVYGSHNVQITNHSNRKSFYGDDVWGKIAQRYDMKNLIPEGYIVYGEIYGKGIQELEYGLDDIDIVIFDVKKNGQYLDWDQVVTFCNQHGLKHVPQLYVGTYRDGILDKYTSGNSILCGSHIREGVVIHTAIEDTDPKIGRKILKSISEAYLLNKNRTEFH